MAASTSLFDTSTPSFATAVDNTSKWWEYGDMFIHPHWRQYDIPAIPDMHFYLVGIYIGLIGIVGIIGNVLVIYTFGKTKHLRTAPNMFIINLAVSDMIFSAINGFPLFTLSTFQRRWRWGMKTCEIYGLIGGITGLLSINTMCLISLDRYFVIVQPFEALKNLTKKRALVMIIVAWIWSAIWAGLPLVGFGAYIPEGFQTSCTFDYLTYTTKNIIFNLGMYIFGFFVPTSVIIFSYTKIVFAVREHERQMAKMAKEMDAKDMRSGKDSKTDVKTAKITAFLVSLYILSWGPYAIIALIGLFGNTDHLTPLGAQIPVLFAKTSAVYNPIVYAISHPKYKAALVKEFPCLACFVTVPPSAKTDMSRTDTKVSRQGSSSVDTDVGTSQSTATIATTVVGKSPSTEMTTIGKKSTIEPTGNTDMHM